MKTRVAFMLSLLSGAFLLASCDDNPSSTASTAAASPVPAASAVPDSWTPDPGAALSADPNPVPAGRGPGTAKISWRTGGRPTAAIYVMTDGGTEQLFAEGSEGTSDAPWIQAAHTYEFRLYSGTDRQLLLGRLTVTGTK